MKKLVMTAAVMGFAASIVSAQVYSQNIVGYSKDTAAGAEFHISSMQFDAGSGLLSAVYGTQLPLNSKIYLFNGTGYDISTFTSVFVPSQGLVQKWNPDLTVNSGDAYWVQTPAAAEAVLAGEVPLADSITNSIPVGYSLVSYPYPVERTVAQLDLSPVLNDKIYVYNGSGYTISTYTSVFVPSSGLVQKWNPDTTVIGVGQGFWYQTGTAQTWIANKPF